MSTRSSVRLRTTNNTYMYYIICVCCKQQPPTVIPTKARHSRTSSSLALCTPCLSLSEMVMVGAPLVALLTGVPPVEHAAFDLAPLGCPSTTLRPCSGHGTCTEARRCRCDHGFSGPSCDHREFLLACPQNCSSPQGACDDGKCVCTPGFSGDSCGDKTPVNCSAACLDHGECVDGQCVCAPGFYGESCQLGCAGFDVARGVVCSGHGTCTATGSPGHSPDRCKCDAGFSGDGCENDMEGVASCPHDCRGHGVCRKGRCSCEPPFAGQDCSIEIRHGELATLLDTSRARLVAALACFALTAGVAVGALRWINALDDKPSKGGLGTRVEMADIWQPGARAAMGPRQPT